MPPDDDLPRATKAVLKNLEPMGIQELQDYIATLQAEITRVQAEMAKKQAHLAAADNLFRK